jgi:predicted aspartyl protease
MWRRAMFALVLIACRHAQTLPITMGPARELLVPAVIDDQPVELQLDTGASNTTLSKAASARLHLELYDTKLHAVGAAGTVSEMSRARVPKLALGDFDGSGLSVSVIDLGSDVASDGLLAMDVLGRLIVDVDFAHATFTPHNPQERGWRPIGLVELPCRVLEGGQVAIDATIDGRPVTAIIDLGANASFANELAAPQRSDATVRVVTAAVGADGHVWQFRGFDEVGLRAADVAFVAHTLLVADLPIFAELGLAHQPAVIVGTDLLARRRIAIDALHRRVYVSR